MTELAAYLRRSPTARAVRSILGQAALPVSGVSYVLRARASKRSVGRVVLELRRLGAVAFAYRGFVRRGKRMVNFWRAS